MRGERIPKRESRLEAYSPSGMQGVCAVLSQMLTSLGGWGDSWRGTRILLPRGITQWK